MPLLNVAREGAPDGAASKTPSPALNWMADQQAPRRVSARQAGVPAPHRSRRPAGFQEFLRAARPIRTGRSAGAMRIAD